MTFGFGGFFPLQVAAWGCGCGGCRVGGGSGFRCVLLCLQIMMKLKILNSIKKLKYPKLLQKSL